MGRIHLTGEGKERGHVVKKVEERTVALQGKKRNRRQDGVGRAPEKGNNSNEITCSTGGSMKRGR